jgi:hypothetical protein
MAAAAMRPFEDVLDGQRRGVILDELEFQALLPDEVFIHPLGLRGAALDADPVARRKSLLHRQPGILFSDEHLLDLPVGDGEMTCFFRASVMLIPEATMSIFLARRLGTMRPSPGAGA